MSETGQPQAGGGPTRKRRWLGALLVVSLALNLLFFGLVAGAIWSKRQGGWVGPRHHAFATAMRRVMKELPEDRRKVAEEIVTRHRAKVRPLRRQVRQARHAAVEGLEADTFDAAAFAERLERLQSAEATMRKAMAGMAMELMKTLTPEERRLFVQTVKRERFRGRGRPRGGERWHPKEGP